MKTLAGRTQIYSCSSQQLGKARKQPLTVSAQFQQSLHSLMDTLNQANPFFIRCIKSNSHKVSSSILIASQQPSVCLWFVLCTSKNSDCMTYHMFPSHTASIWCHSLTFYFLLPASAGNSSLQTLSLMQIIKIIFTKEFVCSELEQFLIPLCCIVVFCTFLCWVRDKFETLLGCVVVQIFCEYVFWALWWSLFLMPGTNQWCGYMDLLFEWFYLHWCTEVICH